DDEKKDRKIILEHDSLGLPGLWCRRRDSNSHGFRHRPLKTACLPISPRRHCIEAEACLSNIRFYYFGTSFAFGSDVAGALGAVSPPAAGAGGAAGCSVAESITALSPRGRCDARYASVNVVMKNTTARTAVLRERKLAEPLAPNRLPEAPLPKAAPTSAPLPCCRSTRPTI